MAGRINPKEYPWWREYFVYDVTMILAGGTGVAYTNFALKVDSDSNYEFVKTTYVSTDDRVKLKYRDDSAGRYLMKSGMDIKSIAGRNTLPMGFSNAFIPFVWPRPYLIGAGANFTVEASDYSGVPNTMRLVFHGAKIRPGKAPWDARFRAQVPVVYGFDGGVVTVAPNATVTQRIEIDMDAHFLVQKITGIRTGDALININEGARGKEWSNIPVHIDNMVGNGSFPNILPANRFVIRGSVLTVNIQNLMGINNLIEINIAGVKLYE